VLFPVFLAPPTDPIKSFFHSVGVILFIEYFPYNQQFLPYIKGKSPVFDTHRFRQKGLL